MEKVTLRTLTLAAAAIAPKMIASGTQAIQVKNIEKLSGEELYRITKPAVRCIYDLESKQFEH